MKQLAGILDIFTQKLVEKEAEVKGMPAGDERAKRYVIIEDIRRLLIACDAANDTRRADKLLDQVELEIDRI